MDQRQRLIGEADVPEGEEDLVGSVEGVVLTGGRCAHLDRVDVEQRFDPGVWLLDDDANAAAIRCACAQERDDLGRGREIGTTISIRSTAALRSSTGFGAAGSEEYA